MQTVLVDGYRVVRAGHGRTGVHGVAQERVLAGATDPEGLKSFDGLAQALSIMAVAWSSMVAVVMAKRPLGRGG